MYNNQPKANAGIANNSMMVTKSSSTRLSMETVFLVLGW